MSYIVSSIKNLFKSSRVRTTVALAVIAIAAVAVFFGPKEPDPNIGLVTDVVTPTVGTTNLVGTLMVNRSVDFRDVHFTIIQVQEAGAFSDDHRRLGNYTVRVQVQAVPTNKIQSPTAITYDTLVHLVLADGTVVAPRS